MAACGGRVLVLGGGGLIGRFLVDFLREAGGVEVLVASRRLPGDLDLPWRRLDLADPASYAAALAGIDILVHAAGPFHHDPAQLVRACMAAGIHYVDIADDAAFLARVSAACREQAGTGAAVVPGCSTVPGLVGLLAGSLVDPGRSAEIDVYLNMGSRNPVSAGLLASLLQPLGRPVNGGGQCCFRRLVTYRHDDGLTRHYGLYPFPSPQGITLGERRLPVRFFVGFDRLYLNRLLQGASHVVPRLPAGMPSRLARRILPLARFCRRFGGREGHLLVAARDGHGGVLGTIEVIAPREGLRLTAAPAVWAVLRLLEGAAAKGGLMTLDKLVDGDAAMAWMVRRSYEVRVHGEARV